MSLLRAIRDRLLHATARVGLGAVSRLGPEAAYAAARLAGRCAHALAGRRRRIVRRNLDIGFRDALSDAAKDRIARRSFQHAFASLAGLALRCRQGEASAWLGRFAIPAEEEALLAQPAPGGLALLGAHVGDWEMTQHYLSLRGLRVAVVTRTLASELFDRELSRLREASGGRVIRKQGALLAVRSALRRGEAVGILADQNCPHRERFFSFLGVLASTYTEYARVLVRSRARILFCACVREGLEPRFRVIVRDLRAHLPGRPAVSADPVGAQADALVRAYLDTVEELVRAHPEQYLWLHRRWKSRPTGAPWLYHDLRRPLPAGVLEMAGP
jgi:KDO2-lipid IV(A) lauroyltransferase